MEDGTRLARLRAQVERTRRLARSITDETARIELCRFAAELEEKIAALVAKKANAAGRGQSSTTT